MAAKNEKIKPLTKSEVYSKVIDTAAVNGVELNKQQLGVILESYEKVIFTEWKEKGEFKLLNIGKLKIKTRPAREGINPATGETVKYPAKTVPKFTFNKIVKEFILENCKVK